MRTSNLIISSAVATTALADPARVFYAEANGELVPMSNVPAAPVAYLALDDATLPPVPEFNLNNGVASTGSGKDEKVFGVVNDYLTLGSPTEVEPFKLELDENSKVLNFQPQACKYPQADVSEKLLKDDSNSKPLKCYSADIYLMTPADAEKYETSIGRRQKRGDDQSKDEKKDKSHKKSFFYWLIRKPMPLTSDAGKMVL